MKNLFFTVSILVIAVFMSSCVSTVVNYSEFTGEVATFKEDAPIEKVHYSSEDLASWDILVLDTINTKKSLEMLAANSAALVKYHNKTAAIDSDPKVLIPMQNELLEKTFHSVSYEEELGKEYDAIFLRDYWVFIGSKSGKMTSSFVSFDLVYKNSSDMALYISSIEKDYVRGVFISSQEIQTEVPYPATDSGLIEGNKKALEVIEAQFKNGIDVLCLHGNAKVGEKAESETAVSTPQQRYTGKSDAELLKYRSFREATEKQEGE